MFPVKNELLYLQIDKENYTAWNKTENVGGGGGGGGVGGGGGRCALV